jgi:hypothetical protein
MSRRKKKNKAPDNTALDLHGIKHQDVDRIVENHIFLTPTPHDIITGNSAEMHRITKSVLDRHGFKYIVGDINNKGYIRVVGWI